MNRLTVSVLCVLIVAISESLAAQTAFTDTTEPKEADAKSICKALDHGNKFYNYRKYRRCVDAVVDLLKTMDRNTIIKKYRLLPNFGMETALYAVKYFTEHQWEDQAMKAMGDGILANKDMDFSRQTQIEKILGYAEYAWWKKLMNSPDFLGKFRLYSVIDAIVQNPSMKGYITEYFAHVVDNRYPACTTFAAMDLFKFLSEYETNPLKQVAGTPSRGVTASDHAQLFAVTCPPANGWNDRNLAKVLPKGALQDTAIGNVKLFMVSLASTLPGLQATGILEDYNVNIVISLVEHCNIELNCFKAVLRSVQSAIDMGIAPTGLSRILKQIREKNYADNGAAAFAAMHKMADILRADGKPKYFAGKDGNLISTFIFSVLDFQEALQDWAYTERCLKRVFKRAAELHWGMDKMSEGMQVLLPVGRLFGTSE